MLKTVRISSNSKIGPIASTYRAGAHNTHGTCPAACALNPHGDKGASLIDGRYLLAVRKAVPLGGKAWTYSHFAAHLLPVPVYGETVINFSADTIAQAIDAHAIGRAVTFAAARGPQWPRTIQGVRFIQCPEQRAPADSGFTCSNCGGARGPICAQPDRRHVVVFVAHGSTSRLVGDDQAGGCYAGNGPVAIQWHATRTKGAPDDARAVRAFARSLPHGSLLRHHIAGDMGRAPA
jgi:hypothetical protein